MPMLSLLSRGPISARQKTLGSRASSAIATAAIFSSLLLSGGCGSNTPEIPDELLTPVSTGSGNYPGGPYGAEAGDTIENLSFTGWRNPLAVGRDPARLETLSFSDFFDPDGEEGFELILLNTAAAWCQPCRIEHADLPDRNATYGADGLVIFSLLFQNADGEPATTDDLSLWTNAFDTDFPIALDPDFQMGRYGPAETPPTNLVVDARTMKILRRFDGNQEGPLWAFIEQELDDRSTR